MSTVNQNSRFRKIIIQGNISLIFNLYLFAFVRQAQQLILILYYQLLLFKKFKICILQ